MSLCAAGVDRYYSVSGDDPAESRAENELHRAWVKQELTPPEPSEIHDDAPHVFRRAVHFQFHDLRCALCVGKRTYLAHADDMHVQACM